jgi:hypothetical protein
MAADYNVWNEMFKQSQNMMNEWISAFTNKEKEETDTSGQAFDFTSYQDWMAYQQKWFKDWQAMAKNMSPDNLWTNTPYSTWVNMMDTYNPFDVSKLMAPFSREVFEKMQNSQKLYLGAYEQWKKFNDQIVKPGTEKYKENIDNLVDQFNKMFMNNMVPLLPKEFQGLMLDSQSYVNTYFKSLENFIGPWSYAYQNIADIAMKSIFEDPMSLSDALKEWKKAYDKTFGILVKSPVVGSSREMLEQNNKAIDAMIDMLVSVSEFMTKASSVGYKYSKEAFADYLDSLEKGGEAKTFKEFYNMWSKHVEDAIETYFYTDEFSKLIAKTADSAMIFKIEYDKVIEKALADLPIVTMSQVDNVYKNVYDLRRELRELKKELEELKNESSDKSNE